MNTDKANKKGVVYLEDVLKQVDGST